MVTPNMRLLSVPFLFYARMSCYIHNNILGIFFNIFSTIFVSAIFHKVKPPIYFFKIILYNIFMKKFIIYLIRLYQKTPLHFHTYCRYTPTCSQYMIDSINEYGLIKGIFNGIKRIFRCNPFGGYGYDPVKKEIL